MKRRILGLAVLLSCGVLVSIAGAESIVANGMRTNDVLIPTNPPAIVPDRLLGTVLIDFDDAAQPCFFFQTVRLTSAYAGLGVVFAGPGGNNGGAILNECGNFDVSGHSSPNFLAFNCNATLSDGGIPTGPETLTFADPVSMVEALVGTGFGQGSTLTMEAYNTANQLVDSDAVVTGSVLQSISVSAPGIVRVVLGTTQPCIWVLDDLAFEGEPTSVDPTSWGGAKNRYR